MEAERRVKDLEQLKANLREQNAKLETKLMHAKSQIDIEIRKRLKLEADKNSMVCLSGCVYLFVFRII